jgi:hypothetical protein
VNKLPEPHLMWASLKSVRSEALTVVPTNGGVEAYIGPVYLYMSWANWREVIAQVQNSMPDVARNFTLVTDQ